VGHICVYIFGQKLMSSFKVHSQRTKFNYACGGLCILVASKL